MSDPASPATAETSAADSASLPSAGGTAPVGETGATGAPVPPPAGLSAEAFEALVESVVARVAPMVEDYAKKAVADAATDLTAKLDALATQVETASPAAIRGLVKEAHDKIDGLAAKLRHWL